MAEPLPNHGRVGGLNTVDDATQVHRNDPMPGIDGVIRDLACKNNSGIVEDVVNAAQLLNRLGHKLYEPADCQSAIQQTNCLRYKRYARRYAFRSRMLARISAITSPFGFAPCGPP